MTHDAAAETAHPPNTDAVDPQEIQCILAAHRQDRGGVIAILQEIQDRCGYLPEQALRTVSAQTGRSLVDVYGIATFYRAFSLVPRGRHLVCACMGTACHVRGAPRIVDELERQLGIQAGQTTEDGQFTLETVNCLGACALGPVVVIDGRYFSKVRTAEVAALLEQGAAGLDKSAGERDGTFPIAVNCPRCHHSLMDEGTHVDGLPSIGLSLATKVTVCPCHVSCLYGSASMTCEAEIREGDVFDLFCPRCHDLLAGDDEACDDCGAPMASLAIQGGGRVSVCQRCGCHGRRLDLECVNA